MAMHYLIINCRVIINLRTAEQKNWLLTLDWMDGTGTTEAGSQNGERNHQQMPHFDVKFTKVIAFDHNKFALIYPGSARIINVLIIYKLTLTD